MSERKAGSSQGPPDERLGAKEILLAVDLSIRTADERDLEALVDLAAEDAHTSWTRESFASELATSWSRVEVVEDVAGPQRQAVGLLVYWVVADELQLLYIVTARTHRRRGVARAMMGHLCAEASRRDVQRIVLEVRANNHEAIRLYERCGFELEGRRPGYYQRSGEDALLYGARLEESADARG